MVHRAPEGPILQINRFNSFVRSLICFIAKQDFQKSKSKNEYNWHLEERKVSLWLVIDADLNGITTH